MSIKRFDPMEGLRPLQAGAVNDASTEAALHADAPLAYDVYRVADELCIDFDVPGVDPSSIYLALENQFLIVSVSREIDDAGVEVIERGRVHGSFERRLVLPSHWRLDQLRASCANGVLHVRAPLETPSATRMVAVEVPTPAEGGHEESSRGDTRDLFDIEHEQVGSPA
jgi:HSP20 family protein